MNDPDQIILEYLTATVRNSDLQLLHGGDGFLNESLMEFYFGHLSHTYPVPGLLILTPSVTRWMIGSSADGASLGHFCTQSRFAQQRMVLFPINNGMITAEDRDRNWNIGQGPHWALVVYLRAHNRFFLHDCCLSTNGAKAERLVEAVRAFVEPRDATSRHVQDVLERPPIQGHDNGLFVCAVARGACRWFEAENQQREWLRYVTEPTAPDAVAHLRIEMLEMIQGLVLRRRNQA